jgi:hypothetical protein
MRLAPEEANSGSEKSEEAKLQKLGLSLDVEFCDVILP